MSADMRFFRIAGNLYFAGSSKGTCHVIDTGEGLILIDAGDAGAVLDSLGTLGFTAADVKFILLSNGRSNHSGGAPEIAAASGAKVLMFGADAKYLPDFAADAFLHDGDVIRLGNTEIHCLATPGCTEGAASFLFNVTGDGRTLRAGIFGGADAGLLAKAALDAQALPYLLRGEFFRSIARLRSEPVDIALNDIDWTASANPFIDSSRWSAFLVRCGRELEALIEAESRSEFVNYAHRGASEYLPENTLLSFYTGVYMGANGVETDVRRTKDGELVLFHDDSLGRVTGGTGAVEDYTYAELQQFLVRKNGHVDRIVRFEEFLQRFSFRDLTFAIELKGDGCEEQTAELLRRYNMEKKTVVTSFGFEKIRLFKQIAPEFRIGFLARAIDADLIARLKAIGADEICPKAEQVTPELVRDLHREGFRVRAWGVGNEGLMRHVYDCHADGMTVNFPDRLTELLRS